MRSKDLVDPQLAPMLDVAKPFDLTPTILPPVRQMMVDMIEQRRGGGPANVTAEERRVPGPDGAPEVGVILLTPSGGSAIKPAYLYMHGGGYVMGAAGQGELTGKAIADELDCVVLSVDYRLAPETPHPGPVEDCYAALKWLHDNAATLGVDPTRIAIGGESAGGGLAAALALLARDRGEIPVKFQLLSYPMIDDRTCAVNAPHPFAGEFVWIAADNHFGWRALLGREPGSDGVSPYAAAARAEDLSGLPPAFIAVGALDIFVDEDIEYARRLVRAGVPTELHVVPGAFHGFDLAVPTADVSQRYRDYMIGALGRALQA